MNEPKPFEVKIGDHVLLKHRGQDRHALVNHVHPGMSTYDYPPGVGVLHVDDKGVSQSTSSVPHASTTDRGAESWRCEGEGI